MRYDFLCEKCDEHFILEFSMKDDEGRNNAKCQSCGCKLKRIYSAPAIIMKGGSVSCGKQMSVNSNGEEIKLGFAEHGNRSGLDDRSIGKRMKGARVDEKTGRLVVDVVSNVKDPLGTISKNNSTISRKKVGQKYKVR